MTKLAPLLALALVAAAATSNHDLSQADVERWMTELSNWNRWGNDDQTGTVNLITPAKRKQAASLVREGVSVSLARDTEKSPAPDNPNPFGHKMI